MDMMTVLLVTLGIWLFGLVRVLPIQIPPPPRPFDFESWLKEIPDGRTTEDETTAKPPRTPTHPPACGRVCHRQKQPPLF